MNRGKALPRKKAARAAKKPKVAAKARRAPATRPVAARPDQAVRDLAKRIVELTVAGDDEATLGLYADGIESTEMGMPTSVGLDAIRQKFVGWRNMVSQSAFRPRRVCVDGNTIMIEWDGRVTLAANGKVVDLLEVAVHEIENGKIARERYYYNPAALAP
jgi:ketosteroid isomerase-like protein